MHTEQKFDTDISLVYYLWYCYDNMIYDPGFFQGDIFKHPGK